MPLGDNFPDYKIALKLLLMRERNDMIQELLKEDLGKITRNDIIDMKIDLELYNKECRKQLIKERYKHRKLKND